MGSSHGQYPHSNSPFKYISYKKNKKNS